MFCVIQEMKRKKPPREGAYKEFHVNSFTICGNTSYSYSPVYEAGKFARTHQESYRISIHHSYREGGKVKKLQCAIATIGYYELIEWPLYDCIDSGVQKAVEKFGSSYDTIYAMVEDKLKPLIARITKEYRQTEEYRTVVRRKLLLKNYWRAKTAFAKKYAVAESEYDYCFNVFGEIMNQKRLEQIRRNAAYQRSYSGNFGGNYGGQSGGYSGSCPDKKRGAYTGDEQQILKRFYKALSLKFHPDLNPDADTTKEMQLLNRLKEDWDV